MQGKRSKSERPKNNHSSKRRNNDRGLSVGADSINQLLNMTGTSGSGRSSTKKVRVKKRTRDAKNTKVDKDSCSEDGAEIDTAVEVEPDVKSVKHMVGGAKEAHALAAHDAWWKEQVRATKKYKFNRNKSGHYTVHSTNDKLIRITSTARIPFGLEYYNDREMINLSISDINNGVHNSLFQLINISKDIENLVDDPHFDYITKEEGLTYHSFIEERTYVKVTDKESDKAQIPEYAIRCYLTPGVKINHPDYFGNYDKRDLAGRRCVVTMRVGSLWKAGGMYGCTMYIECINILTTNSDD